MNPPDYKVFEREKLDEHGNAGIFWEGGWMTVIDALQAIEDLQHFVAAHGGLAEKTLYLRGYRDGKADGYKDAARDVLARGVELKAKGLLTSSAALVGFGQEMNWK